MSYLKNTKYPFYLCLLFGGLMASGCVQTRVECGAAIPILCGDNEEQGGEICGDDEADCRAESAEVCGDEVTVYCRARIECSAIAVVCPDNTRACDPNDGSETCEELTIGEGECAQTIYCEPTAQCQAIPQCNRNEQQSQQPCEDDESSCREETLCGETIYCRGFECAPVAEQCPPESIACDPEDRNPACQATRVGSQGCEVEIFCEPSDMCRAVPTCGPGEEQLDLVCPDDDDNCRIVSVCGRTIYCHAAINCDAVPVCAEGEMESRDPCGDDEEACRSSTVCGSTIYCRPGPMCQAIPRCEEGEAESRERCGDDEANCREETLCGETIYCRNEGGPIRGVELASCEEVELPEDGVDIGQAEIEGDTLFLQVGYGGGCAEHLFSSCFGGFQESAPVQVRLTLGHEDNNDPCDGWLTERLAIDLTPIKRIYQELYQVEHATIIIPIEGTRLSLEYEF